MTVYVVQKHYDYEGSTLRSIHATKDNAVEAAREIWSKERCGECGTEFLDYRGLAYLREDGSCSVDVTIWEVK